jgi:two-component system, LytTR family, sensor histidine kinase AlgZ
MDLPTLQTSVSTWWRGARHSLSLWWQDALTRIGLASTAEPTEIDDGFLPDFCSAPVLVNVVIIAAVFAFITTLLTLVTRQSFSIAQDLVLILLFVEWIALTSVAGLCYARPYMNRLPKVRAVLAAYGLLLLVTLLVSEAAVWVMYAAGRLKTPRPEWYVYFHLQNFTVSVLVNALVLRYIIAKHEIRQRTYSEARAKLQALQSRIRPHFVFNSLNIIASLTRNEPARAEAAIEDMADLFRMMLTEDEQLVPVKKEIDVAKKYLAIETLRLDQRLHVNWEIGTFPRKAAVPVLTLQPLLENAVRHGIESLPAGGTITVKLWEQDDKIYIRVENPFSPTKSKGSESQNRSLDNIRQRLQSHYSGEARLEASAETNRYIVSVVIPTRGGNV